MCTTGTTAFDIRVIGLISSWYITAKCDLFTYVSSSVGGRCELDSRQMELEVRMDLSSNFKDAENWPCGDVVTAVYHFLWWYSEDQGLPPHVMQLLNLRCSKKMYEEAQLEDLSVDAALALRGNKRWQPLLMIALAFAYQSNIVYKFGFDNGACTFKTMSKETNTYENVSRDKLELPRKATELKISPRSLSYLHSCNERYAWVVYTGAGRYPRMKSVTLLPHNLAGWFTYLDIKWSENIPQDSFSLALVCFEICFPVSFVSSFIFSFFWLIS